VKLRKSKDDVWDLDVLDAIKIKEEFGALSATFLSRKMKITYQYAMELVNIVESMDMQPAAHL
jgi:hypothetical protein